MLRYLGQKALEVQDEIGRHLVGTSSQSGVYTAEVERQQEKSETRYLPIRIVASRIRLVIVSR